MSSRYLEMVRSQRPRRPSAGQFTAKAGLALIAFVGMLASAIYWWGVQTQLTDNWWIGVSFTAILVLAPPALTSFLIPWSPGGMLLQKINARTWGYLIVSFASLYLIYYSFEIQYSWWAAQPNVAGTGLVLQQVVVGIIGFIVIPALLWTPVTSEELMEQVKQAHLVKRYELQTQADIAILRNTLLRAQQMTLKGFANLNYAEKEELAGCLQNLVHGIDGTLKEIGQSVAAVSGATIPFASLPDNEDIRAHLDFIAQSLTGRAPRQRRAAAHLEDDGRPAMAQAQERAGILSSYDGEADEAQPVRALPERAPAPRVAAAVPPQQNAEERAEHGTRANAAERERTQQNASERELQTAREHLDVIWTVRELAALLKCGDSTARKKKIAWEHAGLVVVVGDNSYSFTEREVR